MKNIITNIKWKPIAIGAGVGILLIVLTKQFNLLGTN